MYHIYRKVTPTTIRSAEEISQAIGKDLSKSGVQRDLWDTVVKIMTGFSVTKQDPYQSMRFKVGGYNLKLSGTANTSDSFTISDNIGGVGDGRNILAMLDLQEDKFMSEGKGNFQELFSEIVASVGSSVQSAELNKTSAAMIRDAAANSASELSGVNMDDEAAQLIEYQQAYQASARVLQTARELFDTLIDRI